MKEKILYAIESIKSLEISNSRKRDALLAIRVAVNESADLTFQDMFDINVEIDWYLDSIKVND